MEKEKELSKNVIDAAEDIDAEQETANSIEEEEQDVAPLEKVVLLYRAKQSKGNHEAKQNINEAAGSLRSRVRLATEQQGRGEAAVYTVMDVDGLHELDGETTLERLRELMRRRLNADTLEDFLQNEENTFDPIAFYFACHKRKVPRTPEVVVSSDGLVFFYWPRMDRELGGGKDDRLRLIPSLWSEGDSLRMVMLWKRLTDDQKKASYAKEAARFFEVPVEFVDNKFDRVFLTATAVYLVRSHPAWMIWRRVQHPRGEPDWVNIVLGHLARSQEWQAYWKLKFLINDSARREKVDPSPLAELDAQARQGMLL